MQRIVFLAMNKMSIEIERLKKKNQIPILRKRSRASMNVVALKNQEVE